MAKNTFKKDFTGDLKSENDRKEYLIDNLGDDDYTYDWVDKNYKNDYIFFNIDDDYIYAYCINTSKFITFDYKMRTNERNFSEMVKWQKELMEEE